MRNRVSRSAVPILLWFLTTTHPSWVCGGRNNVNTLSQLFGEFSEIHTFSEWLCFDAKYCDTYNGQNTWLKKRNPPNFGPWCPVILAFRMKSPKQPIWMEMGVLIARVFDIVSLDKTPQTTLYWLVVLLGNPSVCVVHFQELSQMT